MPERTVLGGTDGFRGEATHDQGPALINEQTFALLTCALVERQLELGETGAVVIAQDPRASGDGLRRAAIAGALMHGVEVWDLGVAPTPTAQKAAKELGGLATIVVTASHNPAKDNGWKGMVGSNKPSKDVVADISSRYWDYIDDGLVIPFGTKLRPAVERPELLTWYSAQVVASIENEFGETPLQGKLFVIDGANGAAQSLTPDVFRRLGATVEEYACDGSGDINDGCGAANLDGLKTFLADRPEITSNPNFVGAIANDGDGDRVMAVGVIAGGQDTVQLVEVTGNHIMGRHAQSQPGIVGTEYTNSGLVTALEQQGIGFEYCKNGDIFVTERLREKQSQGEDWTRGGEFTGHHIDTTWLSSGDGVRMAAWFASFATKSGVNFGDIYKDLPLWAEKMTKVRFSPTRGEENITDLPAVQDALLQAEAALGKNGRLILRASGTEPVIRIWGEGTEPAHISNIVSGLEQVVNKYTNAT